MNRPEVDETLMPEYPGTAVYLFFSDRWDWTYASGLESRWGYVNVRFRCNVIGGYLLGGLSQQPGLLVVDLHGFLQSAHGSEVSASFTPYPFTLASPKMHRVSPVTCQRDVAQSRYRSELFLLRLGRNFWRTCTVSPGSRAAFVLCRNQTRSLGARREDGRDLVLVNDLPLLLGRIGRYTGPLR